MSPARESSTSIRFEELDGLELINYLAWQSEGAFRFVGEHHEASCVYRTDSGRTGRSVDNLLNSPITIRMLGGEGYSKPFEEKGMLSLMAALGNRFAGSAMEPESTAGTRQPVWHRLLQQADDCNQIIGLVYRFGSITSWVRLTELQQITEEPDEPEMNLEPLRGAARLMLENSRLNPDIGLDVNGNIGLSWQVYPDGVIYLNFDSSPHVRLAALLPSGDEDGRLKRHREEFRDFEAAQKVANLLWPVSG